MMRNKSLLTNSAAILLIVFGVLASDFAWGDFVLQSGLFALSGAFTNWLAIYMLFERIPFVYGSGVIPNQFHAFKASIRLMILENFFNEKNFNQLTQSNNLPFDEIYRKIDEYVNYDELFEDLLEVVGKSSLGGVLSLVGGASVLEPLREPFKKQLAERIPRILEKLKLDEPFSRTTTFEVFRPKIEQMIDRKLEELTPEIVKEIIEKMIREHLGWLVVWGGFFGALIGAVAAFIAFFF